VGKEFLSEFPVLAEESVRCADGAMDVTGAVELYVNRLAGRIAPVRLTGNYGSEILRSNVAFRPRELRSKPFAPELLGQAEKAAQTYADELDACRLSFIAFKQVPWHHFARFAIEQSQLEVRSPYLDNELVALAFQAPAQAAAVEPYLRLIAEGNPQLGRIPTDRGLTCPAGGLANRLRRCFEEFMAKAEYACDYGMPNWLARVERCLSPFRADHLFLGRQKFCHFRTWYRRELAAYVKQVLLDPKSLARAHVNRRRMEHMVHAHLRGSANHTLEIHKSLSLELVHRTLLDH
jgi:asparagine synthase (glutamine-hydrolysing)